jgi:hypothetical protein
MTAGLQLPSTLLILHNPGSKKSKLKVGNASLQLKIRAWEEIAQAGRVKQDDKAQQSLNLEHAESVRVGV